MIKRLVALFLVVLMSIESLAAVVGDSDGAAFVTKQEFEGLKKGFADQIDRYNSSLGGKIDGAIADYLDGIKISQRFDGEFDSATNYKFPLVMIGTSTDWTTPKSTNDYYMLARPRVRFTNITNVAFGEINNISLMAKVVSWDSTTADAIITAEAGTMGDQILYGWLFNKSRDIAGKSDVMYQVSQTSDTRKINTTNYKIFNLINYGRGYQYFDYKPVYGVTVSKNTGHFGSSNSNGYAYFGAIGTAYIGDYTTGTKTNPGNEARNWTESRLIAAGSGWNNMTTYNQRTSSYIGTKVKIKDIAEWHWHGDAAMDYNSVGIDSVNFVWSEIGKKSILFAGSANMPAEVLGKFALSPDWTDGLNTLVEAIAIDQYGFPKGFAYNITSAARTSGHFLARATTYCPPLKPVAYNGYATTVPSFSSLPASCVRYYDSAGNAHYMDEGMFLRNFESNCSIDLDLLFKGKSTAVKNLRLNVSKKPFSRGSSSDDLLKYKWEQGSSSGTSTSATISTETKVSIRVEDILKGEQIYLYWAPVTSSDYIELNAVQKFKIEED